MINIHFQINVSRNGFYLNNQPKNLPVALPETLLPTLLPTLPF